MRFLLLLVAALVSGVLLTACTGAGQTTATGIARPSTAAPTSTSTQTDATDTVAPDLKHISATDAARFGDASGRLQGVLDAIVACLQEDDPGCVSGQRDGFRAAVRDTVHNLTGPKHATTRVINASRTTTARSANSAR